MSISQRMAEGIHRMCKDDGVDPDIGIFLFGLMLLLGMFGVPLFFMIFR